MVLTFSENAPVPFGEKKLPETALFTAYINASIVRFEEAFEPYSGDVC